MFEGQPQEVVAKACAKLAGVIGLSTGKILITISGGKAVKIEASNSARVCCVSRSDGRSVHEANW